VTIDWPGQGQAVFQLSADGEELSYRLIASNIANVVAAHIHIGPAGANGPVVLFLFGPAPPAGGPRMACSAKAQPLQLTSSVH
jgi:CHRD domain